MLPKSCNKTSKHGNYRGETEWEKLPKSRSRCPGGEERILAPRAQLKSDHIVPGRFTHQKAG